MEAQTTLESEKDALKSLHESGAQKDKDMGLEHVSDSLHPSLEVLLLLLRTMDDSSD